MVWIQERREGEGKRGKGGGREGGRGGVFNQFYSLFDVLVSSSLSFITTAYL